MTRSWLTDRFGVTAYADDTGGMEAEVGDVRKMTSGGFEGWGCWIATRCCGLWCI